MAEAGRGRAAGAKATGGDGRAAASAVVDGERKTGGGSRMKEARVWRCYFGKRWRSGAVDISPGLCWPRQGNGRVAAAQGAIITEYWLLAAPPPFGSRQAAKALSHLLALCHGQWRNAGSATAVANAARGRVITACLY